jgi:hypothetical protein
MWLHANPVVILLVYSIRHMFGMERLFDRFFDTVVSQILSPKTVSNENVLYVTLDNDYKCEVRKASSMTKKASSALRMIVCSDTHDRHECLALPEGDIFIHCGDVAMIGRFFSEKHELERLKKFNDWLGSIRCKDKYVIGGNHDMIMEKLGPQRTQLVLSNAKYLYNEGLTLGPYSCWATPYSTGKSPNRSFQGKDFKQDMLKNIPETVDILLTHGHCPDLETLIDHKIHIFGHHHHSYGVRMQGDVCRGSEVVSSLSICAPLLDGAFNATRLPIVLDVLPGKLKYKRSSKAYIDSKASDETLKRRRSSLLRAIMGDSSTHHRPYRSPQKSHRSGDNLATHRDQYNIKSPSSPAGDVCVVSSELDNTVTLNTKSEYRPGIYQKLLTLNCAGRGRYREGHGAKIIPLHQ